MKRAMDRAARSGGIANGAPGLVAVPAICSWFRRAETAKWFAFARLRGYAATARGFGETAFVPVSSRVDVAGEAGLAEARRSVSEGSTLKITREVRLRDAFGADADFGVASARQPSPVCSFA